jgi:hypothetical protein
MKTTAAATKPKAARRTRQRTPEELEASIVYDTFKLIAEGLGYKKNAKEVVK